MLSKLDIRWIWGISFAFIALNSVLIYKEIYWISFIPVAMALLLLAVMSFEKIFFFLVFCTPFSLNIENLEFGGIGMYLPTEPLLFFILIILAIRLLISPDYDSSVLKHPITLVLIFQTFWFIICTFTSELPIVSIKFVLARLWFLATFYLIAIQIFKERKKIRFFFWLYIIPLSGVIIYTVVNHYFHDFSDKPAHFVMKPFFKDHTSYGAVLAMFIPPLLYLFYHYDKYSTKLYTSLLIIIFTVGTIFSYTRAAWLSLGVGLILLFIYKLKIQFKFLAIATIFVGTVLLSSWDVIIMTLEKNRDKSSNNLAEHISSASNITSDASNLERINRWESAIGMFKERPIFGWGPGTYAFVYAPFQHSKSMTSISTNTGRRGNAHSEYIGPLAESGLPGSLSVVVLIIMVFYYGSNIYHRLPKGRDKALILSVLIGFCTYAVHGLLNNYLDTDKASVPFWCFVSIIVAYDLYHKNLVPEPHSQ